ncbi:UNVERIFIED_CONTAM: hypothetical protein Slati_0797200 [Sesamum latifolium]|uniref:Uncharacterized protein n=1 Tax=Sesamum latifolium TaxID=2727402 RepID=A0AAW2XLK2_9LAMI
MAYASVSYRALSKLRAAKLSQLTGTCYLHAANYDCNCGLPSLAIGSEDHSLLNALTTIQERASTGFWLLVDTTGYCVFLYVM